MGYNLIRKKNIGHQGEVLELDYPKLIFLQVNRINEARNRKDWEGFFLNVDSLQDMMEPYAVDSKKYQDSAIEIQKIYDTEVGRIKNKKDREQQQNIIIKKYRSLLRALTILMRQNNLLPEPNETYSDLDA